jgi:hypothetical protein
MDDYPQKEKRHLLLIETRCGATTEGETKWLPPQTKSHW